MMTTKRNEGYKETKLGWIPVSWNICNIDEVAKRFTGHTPDKKNINYWNGTIPWISLKDLSKLDKGFIFETTDYTSAEGIKNSSAVLLPSGTVIISRDATVGKIGIMATEMATSQHFVNYVCGEQLNNVFLYYYLMNCKKVFQNIAIGSTIKTIGMKFFVKMQLILPDIKEQKKIALILLNIDKLLDDNGYKLKELNQLKKALAQKLLTEGIGHTKFKDSEVGRIALEWNVIKLKEIAQICYGKNQKDVIDNQGIYDILGTGGIMGRANKFLWDKPSVLIGRKGTIDKPMYIERPFWTVDTLFYTKVNEKYLAKWLYYYLDNLNLGKYNEATGVPSLSTSNLNAIDVAVPSLNEQKKISDILSGIDNCIFQYQSQKSDYTQLKEGLMQQLLTGKIRV
ncbi:restriction endonuclease subunit S [[Clostridium] fimetarium]|uniref:Type I restriction enzyme, S subunit n=1 Tax=[Clostridium] fimetarium TaxID=99656 RepID=A0A1I0MY18_9FIRM|nr:restriction endonuclease subunit S [[Clostridium] fimetarium]SEV93338.1 type I restriction enzyme, S subunit [[Clostridium] fimetarium]